MASLYDHEDQSMDYDKIRTAVKAMDLSISDERYLLGFFKALEPDGIRVREIIRGLQSLKDDSSDDIEGWEVDKLKEKFEQMLGE